MDYGDVPTWFASIATSGALLITVATVSRDQKDRRERDRRAESKQARGVHLRTIEWESSTGVIDGLVEQNFELKFTNNSEDVIHNIEVGIDFAPNSAIRSIDRKRLVLDHLGVGQTRLFRSRVTANVETELSQGGLIKRLEPSPYFSFTDIEGRRWLRDAEYRLLPRKADDRSASNSALPSSLTPRKPAFERVLPIQLGASITIGILIGFISIVSGATWSAIASWGAAILLVVTLLDKWVPALDQDENSEAWELASPFIQRVLSAAAVGFGVGASIASEDLNGVAKLVIVIIVIGAVVLIVARLGRDRVTAASDISPEADRRSTSEVSS